MMLFGLIFEGSLLISLIYPPVFLIKYIPAAAYAMKNALLHLEKKRGLTRTHRAAVKTNGDMRKLLNKVNADIAAEIGKPPKSK